MVFFFLDFVLFFEKEPCLDCIAEEEADQSVQPTTTTTTTTQITTPATNLATKRASPQMNSSVATPSTRPRKPKPKPVFKDSKEPPASPAMPISDVPKTKAVPMVAVAAVEVE